MVQFGTINIRHENKWVDLASASPHEILDIRRKTLGYVSQFLRVIPRISTIDLVSVSPESIAKVTELMIITVRCYSRLMIFLRYSHRMPSWLLPFWVKLC